MDTSQEYIKMCDCKEVQKSYYDIDEVDHFTIFDKEKKIMYWRSRYTTDQLMIYEVWVPHQDQLQNMIYHLACDYRMLQDFYYWCQVNRMDDRTRYRIKGMSLEQLWLQFYMWREHEKVWTEEGEWKAETSVKEISTVEKITGVKPQFVLE